MKVSSRADYALSCVLRIADKYGDNRPVTVGEVAKKEKLESDYVEHLFIAMRRSGILNSIRGKTGGYVLASPPGKISAKEVIEAIDGSILKLVCFRKKGRRNKCIHYQDCGVRDFWKGLGGKMESFLSGQTLDRLLRMRKKKKSGNFA